MRLKIKYRLFLAMLAATGAVVLAMFLIMQWSIGRGFLRYVNTIEEERLGRLAAELEQAYGRSGGWDFLKSDPEEWLRIVYETHPAGEGIRPPPAQERFLPPPRFPHQFEARVLLFDQAKNRLAGMPVPETTVDLRPLHQGRRTVGYLGFIPRKRLTDALQLRFIKQQTLAMSLVAGVMLLVSAGVSLPLANRLVRPIRRLAEATHRLASGDYGTRVPEERSDELGRLARDFNALALTLEKNEQTRRQWVADISHELRTPLAVLRGEIEALEDGVREPTTEAIRSLHAEVMHLGRLVNDLYQLSLSDVGALTYRKEETDLAAALTQGVDSFREKFRQKDLSLKTAIPAGTYPIFGDRERLHQLFANLLENSWKYTDAGGGLSIRLERQEGTAVVEFQDTAPGVPEADLERLFDRLYRVESSRSRATGGAGLGLAICRNIVDGHQGSIEAFPSPLGGLRIRIELPLMRRTG